MAAIPDRTARADARAAIATVPSWYHTIEVAPGVATPGAFDLRGVVDRLPWPDVRGKRCLDVGTYDGFLAFELEKRGAAEVVAIDLPGYEHWDWELHQRRRGPEYMRRVAGPHVGAGVRVARELLSSSVRLEQTSVYELDPHSVGSFDVVVCGSLLLHLREPLRALAAIRSVCEDSFLSTNHVELGLTLLHPRRPVFRLDGTSGVTQWWLANRAGNRQLLRAGGFEIVQESRLYSEPFGTTHAARSRRPRALLGALTRIALTGGDGVPHHALLARPA
jgi:2-polyprenyl-3-methyl-5-hydroxy-6-metoxy-1,4-benzoquinol methylase